MVAYLQIWIEEGTLWGSNTTPQTHALSRSRQSRRRTPGTLFGGQVISDGPRAIRRLGSASLSLPLTFPSQSLEQLKADRQINYYLIFNTFSWIPNLSRYFRSAGLSVITSCSRILNLQGSQCRLHLFHFLPINTEISFNVLEYLGLP